MSFLRARSPVTPKMTRLHGPAIRGRRLSRSSRSGLIHPGTAGLFGICVAQRLWLQCRFCFVDGGTDAVKHLLPRLHELVDTFVLEDLEDIREIDADGRQLVEHALG